MNYISYIFKIKSKSLDVQTISEIIIAELGEVGFESFTETEEGMIAYIQKKNWHENILSDIQILGFEAVEITFEKEEIEQVNWNSEWEKNFEPIQVDDLVSLRSEIPHHL